MNIKVMGDPVGIELIGTIEQRHARINKDIKMFCLEDSGSDDNKVSI